MAAAVGDGVFAGGGVIFECLAGVGRAYPVDVGEVYGIPSDGESRVRPGKFTIISLMANFPQVEPIPSEAEGSPGWIC